MKETMVIQATRRGFLYALGSAALAQKHEGGIESLWIGLGKALDDKKRDAFARVLTDPALAKIDALFVLIPPPTFAGHEAFLSQLGALQQRAKRPIVYMTYPVGTEGWETSNHARAAKTAGGFLPGQNMSREKWFERMAAFKTGLLGLDIETMARPATLDEMLGYIRAFGAAARANSRKSIVWYPANWERYKSTGDIARPLWSKAADAVDYVVWMDTKTTLEDSGEDGVRRRIREIRDLTGDKAVIQIGLYGPEEATYAEARVFLRLAKEGGVRRFALWANPLKLDSPAFTKFYAEL